MILSDQNLNLICQERCVELTYKCIIECDPSDQLCITACLREDTTCIQGKRTQFESEMVFSGNFTLYYLACPCESECIDGCEGCHNPVCQCKEKRENPEWNSCIDSNSIKLGRCMYDCNDDLECETDCTQQFKSRQQNCPCEDNCSAGCPCDDFDCDSGEIPGSVH